MVFITRLAKLSWVSCGKRFSSDTWSVLALNYWYEDWLAGGHVATKCKTCRVHKVTSAYVKETCLVSTEISDVSNKIQAEKSNGWPWDNGKRCERNPAITVNDVHATQLKTKLFFLAITAEFWGKKCCPHWFIQENGNPCLTPKNAFLNFFMEVFVGNCSKKCIKRICYGFFCWKIYRSTTGPKFCLKNKCTLTIKKKKIWHGKHMTIYTFFFIMSFSVTLT